MILRRRQLLLAAAGQLAVLGARPTRVRAQGRVDPFAAFKSQFHGRVVLPEDAAYDSARRIASVNPTTDLHPRAIARCGSAEDVTRAIRFAREQSLELAIRAGGHDVLGASTCDGGLVVDLGGLKAIHLDRTGRTATLEPGVRAGELAAESDQLGLAPVLGCFPGVGVTGLSLGGGFGWILGRFGTAADQIESASVVLADGSTVQASADDHPDLLWALKGGGGNFGVVTSLRARLQPLEQVLGGPVAYRGDMGSFLRFYRDFMHSAADELMVELRILRIGGEPTLFATPCWSGDLAVGERVLQPLRAFGPPLADAVRAVSLAHLTDPPGPDFGRRLFGSGPPPARPSGPFSDFWRAGSLPDLSDAAIARLAAAAESLPEGCSVGLGHFLHGEACHVGMDASPLPRPRGQICYFVDANWRDLERTEKAMAWVQSLHGGLKALSSGGDYVNYLSSGDPAAVKDAYGPAFSRLAALKRRYDPDNVFHRNRNILPA